jgi:hypothetical protein
MQIIIPATVSRCLLRREDQKTSLLITSRSGEVRTKVQVQKLKNLLVTHLASSD